MPGTELGILLTLSHCFYIYIGTISSQILNGQIYCSGYVVPKLDLN